MNRTANSTVARDARFVEVNTRQFEFAHGRKPRGNGSWAFSVERNGNCEFCFWFNGTFAAASKAARFWAAEQGVSEVFAQS